MRAVAAVVVSIAILCLAPAARAADAFTVSFTWEGAAKCMDPKSPPFTLSHVPAGTKTLRFNMVDLDFTAFHHGGGTIAYDGKDAIARGALDDFRGPCPPAGQHHYEWTIEALDSGGKVLGAAKTMKPFPPE